MDFPDPTNVLSFNLTLSPDEGKLSLQPEMTWGKDGFWRGMSHSTRELMVGMYKGGLFKFTFNINPNYPHEPPKVLCTQKVSPFLHSSLPFFPLLPARHPLSSYLISCPHTIRRSGWCLWWRRWSWRFGTGVCKGWVAYHKIYHPNLDLSGNICLYVCFLFDRDGRSWWSGTFWGKIGNL